MIEEELYNYILKLGEVTALIGDKVYPMQLPEQATLPAVTYMQISNNRQRSHSGTSMRSPTFQISSWASDYITVKRLADRIREALDNFSGRMGTYLVTAFHENDRDIYEPDTGIYHIPIDFEVNYD